MPFEDLPRPMRVRWSASLFGVRIRNRLGSRMKILLTSSGITNTTIHDTLVDLLFGQTDRRVQRAISFPPEYSLSPAQAGRLVAVRHSQSPNRGRF